MHLGDTNILRYLNNALGNTPKPTGRNGPHGCHRLLAELASQPAETMTNERDPSIDALLASPAPNSPPAHQCWNTVEARRPGNTGRAGDSPGKSRRERLRKPLASELNRTGGRTARAENLIKEDCPITRSVFVPVRACGVSRDFKPSDGQRPDGRPRPRWLAPAGVLLGVAMGAGYLAWWRSATAGWPAGAVPGLAATRCCKAGGLIGSACR